VAVTAIAVLNGLQLAGNEPSTAFRYGLMCNTAHRALVERDSPMATYAVTYRSPRNGKFVTVDIFAPSSDAAKSIVADEFGATDILFAQVV
jgi:hypothetical protein